MHDYDILKREAISIDNSVIDNNNNNNAYDRNFINVLSKYIETIKLPISKTSSFYQGFTYTIEGNKFKLVKYIDRKPRILLSANTVKNYIPNYVLENKGPNYVIKPLDSFSGEELCIVCENILNVNASSDYTVTRTMNLDDGMIAYYVILRKDNQPIVLSESL